MNVYVLNQLCEIDTNYNECIGVFTNLEEAKEMAHKYYKAALSDLGGERKCSTNNYDNNYIVYNDDHSIEIHIDEVRFFDNSNKKDKEKCIASINWVEKDIKMVLKEEGYKTSESNVKTILNSGKFIKRLEEQSTQAGFEIISDIILRNSGKLETKKI